MKYIMKIIICAAMIAVLTSAVVFSACASGIKSPETLSRSTAGLKIADSSDTTRALPTKRPISGSENLVPTTEPASGSAGSGVIHRPIRGEENLIPTTEPSSGNTGSGTIQRPIRGEENLIPTTAPSTNNDLPNKRPLPGEENLIPTTAPSTDIGKDLPSKQPISGKDNPVTTTPSPTPSGVISKPTTSGATSSNTTTAKPAESVQKPAASISKSPYFTKHPTDESVKQGANAQFVAIAENADGYHWTIFSADGQNTYTISEACKHFKGLQAEGSITTRLTLYYIPVTLHGHYVACIAEGNGETVTSNGALLTIQGVNTVEQVQETQPIIILPTEAVTVPVEETITETTIPETTQAGSAEIMLETTVSMPTAEAVEQDTKAPTVLYIIGGVCAALMAIAIVLMVILLKALRKGKRR